MSIHQTFLIPASLNEHVTYVVDNDAVRPMMTGTRFKVGEKIQPGISYVLMRNTKWKHMSNEPAIYEQIKNIIRRSVMRSL